MVFKELDKTDWEAIASYLSGEMNQQEISDFEQRIASSDSNRVYFEQVKTDWEVMENLKQKNTFNTDKAWGNLYAKMEQDGLLDTKSKSRKFSINRLTKIAAIFIAGMLLTSLVYYMFSDKSKEGWQVADTYENTEIKQITLSDGSIIYLNANSKLYYPEAFEGNTRVVEFEGDGFFEIAKNPAKPFIIKAKDAQIKVLGTSFNVNTKTGKNKVEVLVETGKVQLSAAKDKNIRKILEPGYMGTLENEDIKKEKNTDVNYLSWRTKNFHFEGVKLGKAIEAINRAYNVNIQCEDFQANNHELDTKFENKPIDTVLNILCTLEPLKVKRQGNNIILLPK